MTDNTQNPVVDVSALARLARIDVSQDELTRLEKEIPDILAFVAEISAASANVSKEAQGLHNVMREDANPHESGLYTEDLLSAAPERKGQHIKVPQVIKR
jgi:aspartyl-tRNA(Asn)/glutamyl-tRNA(Gln) amidotransferase subunit C